MAAANGVSAASPPADGIVSESLRVRVLSGIAIGAVTIAVGLLGGLWWAGFVLVLGCLAITEMATMAQARLGRFVSMPIAVLIGAAVYLLVWLRPIEPVPGLVLALLMLGSLLRHIVSRATDVSETTTDVASHVAGWAATVLSGGYIGFCSAHLALLRDAPAGLAWTTVAVGATWLADSAAYLAGHRWGRHRLAPALSPKKTWEGFWGGVVAATVGGLVFGLLVPEVGAVKGTFLAFAAGMVGTLGDLAESLIKREAGAKDSGALIPGHGGVFDRIDSLLWAGVVVYYLARFVGM